jgi:hypothetical protein
MKRIGKYSIEDMMFDFQKKGRITFSNDEVKEKFPDHTTRTIELALNRLISQKKIVPVLKGFYAIIPVEYATWAMVPPSMYLDALMKHLKRSYYLALLNAAELYGAAHQRPQQYSVITVFPSLRDTNKRNIKINFIATRKEIPQSWLKSFKSEIGYIQASKPELTAADLITFQKEVGGLSRACTVLAELMEVVRFGKLDQTFFDYVPTSSIQRLGYLLENELEQVKQADILYSKAHTHGCKFQKIPLKNNNPTKNCETNKKWKIIINEYVEIDEL